MNLNSGCLIFMLVPFTYNMQISIGGVITTNANITGGVTNYADINDGGKKDKQNNTPIALKYESKPCNLSEESYLAYMCIGIFLLAILFCAISCVCCWYWAEPPPKKEHRASNAYLSSLYTCD